MTINKDEIFTGGRHFLGLNHYFLKFPNKIQILRLKDLRIRSSEGIIIKLDVCVTYRLGTANTLKELIQQFINIYSVVKYDWNEWVERISSQTIRDTLSSSKAQDVILKRGDIIQNQIRRELKSNLELRFISLMNIFITNIILPEELNNSFLQIEVSKQRADEINFLLQGLNIQAQTNYTLATIESNTIDYESANKVNMIKKMNNDKITAISNKFTTIYNGMKLLKEKLGLNNTPGKSAAKQLLLYYWIKIMRNEGNKNSKIKLPLPESLREN